MNSGAEYWKIHKFSSLAELNEFEILLKTLELRPPRPFKPLELIKIEPVEEPIEEVIEVKKENRGSKTKQLHATIKEYIKKHPELKYRDVLKDYKNIIKQ